MVSIIKKCSKIVIIFIIVILSLSILFLGLIGVQGGIDYISATRTQKNRLAELKIFYQDNYIPIDESEFVNFDLNDTSIKLNEIQYISTHNAYKSKIRYLQGLIMGTFSDITEYTYDHETLTDQLNCGVRSFELDIYKHVKKGVTTFPCYHAPIIDMYSNSIDMSLTLEELELWSDSNPGHVPITILIESKSDYLILPANEIMDLEGLNLFDELIIEKLGDKLLTPADVLGSYNTFKDMTSANDWIPLNSVLGKIIVVYHTSDVTPEYIEQDTSMQSQSMFPSINYESYETYSDYASFVMIGDCADERILEAVEVYNLIIRTRADDYMYEDLGELQEAEGLGAQMITTDYPPRTDYKEGDYISYLDGQYTVISSND